MRVIDFYARQHGFSRQCFAHRLGIRCLTAFVTKSWVKHFQASTEDIHFYEILTTKCIKRIRDFLSMHTLHLLTKCILAIVILSVHLGVCHNPVIAKYAFCGKLFPW